MLEKLAPRPLEIAPSESPSCLEAAETTSGVISPERLSSKLLDIGTSRVGMNRAYRGILPPPILGLGHGSRAIAPTLRCGA